MHKRILSCLLIITLVCIPLFTAAASAAEETAPTGLLRGIPGTQPSQTTPHGLQSRSEPETQQTPARRLRDIPGIAPTVENSNPDQPPTPKGLQAPIKAPGGRLRAIPGVMPHQGESTSPHTYLPIKAIRYAPLVPFFLLGTLAALLF